MVDALLGGVLSRFRNQPRWRQLAQRLPITKDYERRLVELHQQLAAEKLGSPPSGEFVPPGHFYSAIADRGDIKSRWNAIYGRDPKAIAGVDDIHELDASFPFGRVCEPEDVARVVVFLCSDAAGYVTGERIRVHGGGQNIRR